MNKLAVIPDLRVLVAAMSHKDVEMTVQILNQAGFTAHGCSGIDSICEMMAENAGALLISEELLFADASDRLSETLKQQPPWSDLPILILTTPSSGLASTNMKLEKILSKFRNITLIERPVRIAALITSVRAGLYGRQRQYEVRNLLQDLKESKEIAEAANRAKSSFLANMSHEIRTPLGAILGFSELLKEKNLNDEEKDQYVETIRRNGESLALLIDDILDLSKVESGHLNVERVPVSLPTLLSEISMLLHQSAAAKGIVLKVVSDGMVPEMIDTDPTRLRQILINIVGNAIKFTKVGEVCLTVRSLMVDHNQARLRFEVKDTGCGIAPNQIGKLFQAFSQADESTTRLYGGTGLGLALSQKLARALGGDLTLMKSVVGQGSSFLIEIEAEVVGAPEASAHSPLEAKSLQLAEHDLEGLKVLVAEDTPDTRALVTQFLSSGGAQVEIAINGQEAVQKALSEKFDVILMDIQMPILDGYSATRELREQAYDGPIIALTAHAMKEDRELSKEAGCNDHLTKPINRYELIETVSKYAKNFFGMQAQVI